MLKRQKAFVVDEELLNGRAAGRDQREKIIEYLEEVPADSVVPVDFKRVKFLDFSCTDEMLARLLKRIGTGDLEGRFIVLENLNESARENVDAVLRLRQLACPYRAPDGTIRILGKLHPELHRTYEAALTKGTITARDLVPRFKMKISAASNRLMKLQNLGLLMRVEHSSVERGGRQYIYEPVH